MNLSPTGNPNAYPTFALLRRLLVDEALLHWRRYAGAAALMGIAAAGAALSAYLIGTMTNEAWVNRNFHGIVVIGLLVMIIFGARGLATYFSTVMLSRIGNRIVADNQRRPTDHRRQRGVLGDQSSHHGRRPRSNVADRIDHRDGHAGSDHVSRRLHRGTAGDLLPAQTGTAGA
jgi:ABC-type multidrug transport system fused ATPase/permease subunit